MFERFTERARQVVVLAQEEARTLRHDHIGAEHLLLGLLREERASAARALKVAGVTMDGARATVIGLIGAGDGSSEGTIAFTAPATRALELSLREAMSQGRNEIAPEHILLALLRDDEGGGARVLRALGVEPQHILVALVEAQVIPDPREGEIPAGVAVEHRSLQESWVAGLGSDLDLLGSEIITELKRAPDTGDLLFVLASRSGTLLARALSELGVDADRVAEVVSRLRGAPEAAWLESAEYNELRRRLGIPDPR